MHRKKRINYDPLMEGPLNTVGLFPGDPMGSYSGRPVDPLERPVQDADDL